MIRSAGFPTTLINMHTVGKSGEKYFASRYRCYTYKMKFLKGASMFFILFSSVLLVQVNIVNARTVCPGQPATLNWSSSDVISCTPSYTDDPICNFLPIPGNSGSKAVQLTSGSCTSTLTCSNAQGQSDTKSDTLTVATGRELQTLNCCGQWDMAGKVWSESALTCVDPFSVRPEAPAWIGGSCRRI